ncbi:MAG: hypothetical protein SFV19_02365 [Rhodospirillaceae bacterium]|nr:hypothetical protein [Rhodospirillaceae bacterium]
MLRTALLHELKIPHHAAAEIAKCDTTLRPRPRPDDAPPVRPRAKPGSDDIQRFPQTQDGAIPS